MLCSVVSQHLVGESRVLRLGASSGAAAGTVGCHCPLAQAAGSPPADAGGAGGSAGWQTAAQPRLRLRAGVRAGERNLRTSAPSAGLRISTEKWGSSETEPLVS